MSMCMITCLVISLLVLVVVVAAAVVAAAVVAAVVVVVVVVLMLLMFVYWLRTNGVNTNGAAAKVVKFDGLGKRYALSLLGR